MAHIKINSEYLTTKSETPATEHHKQIAKVAEVNAGKAKHNPELSYQPSKQEKKAS